MTIWERISATLKRWRKRWPQVRARIVETTKHCWAFTCQRWHALSHRQQIIAATVAAVVLITVCAALVIRRSTSSVDRTGSSAAVNDGRVRAVEQTVTDDVKDAKKVATGVADLGDDAKRLAEAELTEMRLSRFNLPLTPRQEFILLDRVRGFWQFAKQLGSIGASAGQRQQKTAYLAAFLEQRIQEGNGPAKAVRLQFARVESLGSEWSSYFFPAEGTDVEMKLEGMPQNLLGRMVRGQDPTAADIAKMIHAAALLASAARRAAEFERQFNGLLVMTIGRTGVATYYGRNDDATPEACLAERLDACSVSVVGLYAHAKDTFDFFLGGTPELPYRFEFPELSPNELRQANALLAELAAKRTAK